MSRFIPWFVRFFVRFIPCSFILWFPRFFTLSFVPLSFRSFFRSLLWSFVGSFVCSPDFFTRSFVSFVLSFAPSVVRWFVRSLVCSIVRLFLRSLVPLLSLALSFVHSAFAHLMINCLLQIRTRG